MTSFLPREDKMRHLGPAAALLLSLGTPAHLAAAEPGDPVVSEVVVDAPVQAVWDALTTRDGMEAWATASHSEIELALGEIWRSSYSANSKLDDDSVIETEVLAFDPPRMLAARTRKPPADFPFPNAILHTWYVTYLEPVGETRTRVIHRMFGFTDDEESQKMRAFFVRGNQYSLEQLATYLANVAR